MTNMLKTIEPKSDRLNADDLIGKSLTITVTKVSLAAGEQPIAINFEGDNGKPYYPCKSMRRVLVNVWGADGNQYVGRSMTLYRDEKVMFGGVAVGGIRISHMSHIDKPVTMALTASRANRKPFTAQPLKVANIEDVKLSLTEAAQGGLDSLREAWAKLSAANKTALAAYKDSLKQIAEDAENNQPKE